MLDCVSIHEINFHLRQFKFEKNKNRKNIPDAFSEYYLPVILIKAFVPFYRIYNGLG